MFAGVCWTAYMSYLAVRAHISSFSTGHMFLQITVLCSFNYTWKGQFEIRNQKGQCWLVVA